MWVVTRFFTGPAVSPSPILLSNFCNYISISLTLLISCIIYLHFYNLLLSLKFTKRQLKRIFFLLFLKQLNPTHCSWPAVTDDCTAASERRYVVRFTCAPFRMVPNLFKKANILKKAQTRLKWPLIKMFIKRTSIPKIWIVYQIFYFASIETLVNEILRFWGYSDQANPIPTYLSI